MFATLARMAPVLRLTRVSTAFAAVADVWFVILWTRANPEERGIPGLLEPAVRAPDGPSLWLLLLAGAGAAMGLYAFGAAINDVTDTSRDRVLRRDRPIAEGQISPVTAATVGSLSLIIAVLGAAMFGRAAVVLTCVLALAVLGFNALGRFVPAVGLVLLSLIYAGHMVVPNLSLRFVWPVWVVMTHALAVSGVVHVVGRKAPPITLRALVAALLGWVFWSGVLIWVGLRRADPSAEGLLAKLWPDWVGVGGAILVLACAVVFVFVAGRRIRTLGYGQRTAEKINRYGALWLPLYACGWLFGEGHLRAGLIMGALALSGLVGMSVLREVYAAVEHPIGYRR
ncbi:MAG: UbiA family prenyltransferase [Phycisphaeraceae bacterium]|nr:MAG: UbiA family prenyltransferase [Phycisphaeraceae bacterium]